MEPQLEIIAGLGPQACKYKIDQDLWPVWHYHPEYDILLNLNRSGSYLVGDRLGTFKPGTLIINGSNIPHAFHASEAPPTDHGPAMIILFFSRASLGEELLARSEMAPIRGLLDELKTGFEITGPTRDEAERMMRAMEHMPKLDRFAHMLILLRLFAESTTKLPLASPAYAPNLSPHHTEKIDRLLQYIRRHYRRTVPLAEAADLVSMSEKAFCRFFKKNTGKTLVQYLNELRIGEACRLLIQTNLPINQICKEAGFGNVSNFNRRFRERKGISPRAYRQATEMAQ